MDWWLIEYKFPDEQIVMSSVMDEFKAAHIAAGAPRDAALFSSNMPEGGKMCLYLSPASTAFAGPLLKRYGAVPCAKPPASSGLLVGFQTAFSLLS